MIEFGVNTDPLNVPHGRPDPVVLRALGLTSVRLVLRSGVFEYIRECRAADLSILGVLANESGDPAQYVGWPMDFLQVGNEPDIESPSSWTMAAAEYMTFAYDVAAIMKAQRPDVKLISAGMASGNPFWLEDYKYRLPFDAIALHPYGQRPEAGWPNPTWGFGNVADLAASYYAVYQKPIWITEYGVDSAQVGDEFQAEYLVRMMKTLSGIPIVEGAFIFCWSDAMV